MRSRVLPGWAMACLPPVFLMFLSSCGGGREAPATNVLIISLDTTREDKIGAYGMDEEISTPHIDRIAGEGVKFSSAYSSVPLTMPSHSTLMTGLSPLGHGVRNNGNYVLPDDVTTLAELLEREGYHTAAFIGAFVLDSQFGLSQGFELYDDTFGDSGADKSGYFGFEERDGAEITDLTCDWLRSAEQPFFLWVHYFDPHYPYEPPAPFDSLYANPYLGEVAFTDSCVGRVVAELDATGLRERTLIIIVGDHGESLGEHGEMSHGIFLYDATMRVPLIMNLPGRLPSGITVDTPVSLADVVPTLADLLGFDCPGDVQGRSVLPWITGAGGESAPIYLETVYPHENYGWSGITGVLSGGWKYLDVTEPELYNIVEDPDETQNLYSEEQVVVAEMEALLDSLSAALTLDYGYHAPSELDAGTREKLESLGYVWTAEQGGSQNIDPKRMIHVVNQIDYGLLLFTRGDLDEAARIFSHILEMDPNNLTAHNLLGICFIKMGRESEALYHWRKVIELKPNSIDARRNLAKVLASRKLYRQAEEQFLTVLELNPDDVKALVELGDIALESGDVESAEEYYARVLEIDPDLVVPYRELADIAGRRGEQEVAISYMEQAFALDTTNVVIRQDLARALRQAGRYRESLRHFRWLASERDDAPSFINLGHVLERVGESEEAIVAFQEAIERDSLSLRAYNSLGTTLLSLGRYGEAESMFMKAVALDENYAEPYFNLGNLYRSMGRKDSAIRSYRTFLELWNGSEAIRQRALNALEELSGQDR